LGRESGNMSQNGEKHTRFMTSLTKKRNPKTNVFFSLQARRLAESFEGFDNSLAQSTGELWSCKLARN